MFKASVQNLTATETEIWGDYMYVLYIKNTNHLNDEQLNTLINFDKVTVEQKEQLQHAINNSTRLSLVKTETGEDNTPK
jgi:hypothetical protein